MIERSMIEVALAHLTDLEARVQALEAGKPDLRTRPAPAGQASPPDPPAALPNPWLPVLHAPPGCGKPALYLTRPFRRDERADRSAMRVCPPAETAWRAPASDDVPVCSGCGAGIHPYSTIDLDWSRALVPAAPQSPHPGTATPHFGGPEPETEPPPPYGRRLAAEIEGIAARVRPDG